MQLNCPHCGQRIAAIDAVNDDCARRLMGALSTQPLAEIAGQLLAYLQLFRPRKQALRWSRALSIAQEIGCQVGDSTIERGGRKRKASAWHWQQGIEEVLATRDAGKLDLPLKSNGYLFEVVYRLAGALDLGSRATHVPLETTYGEDPDFGRRAEGVAALEKMRRKDD